jgi:DNA-binding NarL/FixJ family response regulator
MSVSVEMASSSRRFTPREEAIVTAILAAQSNKEIAASLGISEQSVKNRLTQLYRKLGVSSRLELMRRLLTDAAPG